MFIQQDFRRESLFSSPSPNQFEGGRSLERRSPMSATASPESLRPGDQLTDGSRLDVCQKYRRPPLDRQKYQRLSLESQKYQRPTIDSQKYRRSSRDSQKYRRLPLDRQKCHRLSLDRQKCHRHSLDSQKYRRHCYKARNI